MIDCYYEVNDSLLLTKTVKHKQNEGKKINCLQILNGSKKQTTLQPAGPRRLPPAAQPPSGLVLRLTASLLPLARVQDRHHREREAPTAAPRIHPGRSVINRVRRRRWGRRRGSSSISWCAAWGRRSGRWTVPRASTASRTCTCRPSSTSSRPPTTRCILPRRRSSPP